MELKKYRILLLEAVDIVNSFNNGRYEIVLPQNNKKEFYKSFKNIFDHSLDLEQLETTYKKIYRNNKFSFSDEFDNQYTLSIINIKFYKSGLYTRKKLREVLYENGFYINDTHYVRYKRSSGSSREGKCLFIDEQLLKSMEKWGECGLKNKNFDLASWESYKALSLSSIKEKIKIPLDGILFMKDCEVTFNENVVCVSEEEGKLTVQSKEAKITNDIWDGQSLLDESLFIEEFEDKHMLLLRNKFFKTCAFKTKIQKWFSDNNIKDIDQLKKLGHITFAKDVNQIVMITTPNSLKYLKFVNGFNEKNIADWIAHIDEYFGVVKYDKGTRYFNGRMVQSSYQFLNTIQLSQEECEEIVGETLHYIKTIRNDIDFMKYHFQNLYHVKKEHNESEDFYESEGLAQRAELIFKLLHTNNKFQQTELYTYFRNKVINGLKRNALEGHLLFSGTNATLFGNGPEMLLNTIGKFDRKTSVLKPQTIRCESFDNNKQLVCARSPHITMGNLYVVENVLDGDIWKYFDLGKNIVCVNAINDNIQQRLNGCDYDSDMMLITDNDILVKKARLNQNIFKVPVCEIKSVKKTNYSLVEMDYKTSENKIGEIVNLSQKLNSIIWEKLNNNIAFDNIKEIYEDVCKLAVLSGIEIDKAKRSFNVNVSNELQTISKKYEEYNKPEFFIPLDKVSAKKHKKKASSFDESKYKHYETAMSYIYNQVKRIDFRLNKEKYAKSVPISTMFVIKEKISSTAYAQKSKVIKICEEYNIERKALQAQLDNCDEDEKKVLYQNIYDITNKCYKDIEKQIKSEWVLYLTISELEKNEVKDWHLYAPFLKNQLFINILNSSKEIPKQIIEKEDGQYHLYKFNFDKI